jgi:hypothetical protein
MILLFLFQAFRHTAPSLRLFVSNSLTVYQRSFSSVGCACKVFFFFFGLVFPLVVFSPRVAVITLQPLPPLPPYVRSSRATPDKVLLITSLSSGGAAISTLPAPPLCAVFFFVFEEVDLSTRSNP